MIVLKSTLEKEKHKINNEWSDKYLAKIQELTLRPTKQDIRLLREFVQKGVNHSDIEYLLDLTSIEFETWKTNKEVDQILKARPRQNPERYTMNHPDLDGKTEFAFDSGLKRFYRFKEDIRMPTGRYKYVYKRFLEHELRMNREILEKYLDQIEKIINGGDKGKQISITEIVKIIFNMRTWLKLPFEPGAVKRLAAVVYFTEDEDLSTFVESEGDAKISWWEANGTHDFFSIAPVSELFNLSGISRESLQEYLNEAQAIVKELTLGQSTSSPVS